MKQLSLFLFTFFLSLTLFAQTPEKLSYQAVIRDGSNALVANQLVGMQVSILQGSATGTAVYVETHTPTSNTNGLVSIEMGDGTVVSGSFSTIDWAVGPYFVKTETDPSGGTNYTITGTSQLLSVPYALYSKTAENVTNDQVNDADADPNNEIQVLSISNDTLFLSNGGFAVLPADQVNDADADPNNELQAISWSNDTLYLSNGGSVYLGGYLDDTDTDQQTLSISNDTIAISNGNSVVLPPATVDTDDQTLSLTNDTLYIDNGNSVSLGAYLDNTDAQVLNISNDTLYLSNGGFAILPADQVNDADADPNNELQVLSTANDTLFLSNGGSIFLGTYLDDTDTDDQTLSLANDTLTIADGNFVVLPPATVDTDDQTLSLANDTLSIADGNSVDLSAYAVDSINDADSDPNNEIQTLSYNNDTLSLSGANSVHIAPSGGGIPAGSIMPFAGVNPPAGWLLCDGAEVSRSTFPDLFAVIDTLYGSGNGSTTFNVPDMRGRLPVGKDNMGGTAANVVPAANTLGATGGAAEVTLTQNELPSLSLVNAVQFSDKGCASCSPRPNVAVSATSGSVGADQPHENMSPYLTLNYIIKQ